MGGSASRGPARPLPAEFQDLPPFFTEILHELQRYEKDLGGLKNFKDYPRIEYKVKAEEFRAAYTDYEYVFMTVLGFARLHTNAEDIVNKNNSEAFNKNPGVQMLQRICGMTMHAERPGANALLRSAAPTLLEAYRLATGGKKGSKHFFENAFDRSADPCLEGRTGRLLEYVESMAFKSGKGLDVAPWEDVSLRPLPAGTEPRDLIGEHLRVFMNECTWSWSRAKGIPYEDAKRVRLDDAHEKDFTRLFNAATFEAAMGSRGVVRTAVAYEVSTDGGRWEPYEEEVCVQIERGSQRGQEKIEVRLGPRAWKYEINLVRMVQLNSKTGKERQIRQATDPADAAGGRMQLEQLRSLIQYFVDLCTLPPAPAETLAETLPGSLPETAPPLSSASL